MERLIDIFKLPNVPSVYAFGAKISAPSIGEFSDPPKVVAMKFLAMACGMKPVAAEDQTGALSGGSLALTFAVLADVIGLRIHVSVPTDVPIGSLNFSIPVYDDNGGTSTITFKVLPQKSECDVYVLFAVPIGGQNFPFKTRPTFKYVSNTSGPVASAVALVATITGTTGTGISMTALSQTQDEVLELSRTVGS